jgi:hypothetical protein
MSTFWSWPDSFAIPACLALAESAAGSLLVNAMINSGTGPHIDLPLLAFAIPALVAVAVGAVLAAREWAWWRLVATLAVIGVIGGAVTAATVSQLSDPSASWLLVATHPWSVQGHAQAIAAASGWLVAALTWGRGLWIAVDPPSFRHAVWSASLAALLFVGIFAGRSRSHSAEFLSATSSAGWLLFLWFPFVAAAAALVRQRELEREVLERTRSRPSGAWFAILAVPMAVVALLALLIAVAVGPAAPVIGRGIARAAVATAHGIADAAIWLWRLLPGIHGPTEHRVPPPPSNGQGVKVPPPPAAGHIGTLPVWAQILLLAVGAAIVLAGVIWFLRNVSFRSTRPPKVADVAVEEERDSLFSWQHVRSQLWAALLALLRRLLWWRKRSDAAAPATVAASARQRPETETIRQAYRRVLRAARASGQPRGPSETTRELQGRLAADGLAPGPLGQLTELYDQVRYAEADLDDPAPADAMRHADSITGALTTRPAR